MSNDAMKCLKALHFDEFPSDGKPACGENYHYTFYQSETGEKDTATKVFSTWYTQENDYDYNKELTMNGAAKFIITKNFKNDKNIINCLGIIKKFP